MPSALVSTGFQFPDNSIQTAAIPAGAIVIWNGLISSIPTGWSLCNGSNGTPDLRDRFIVGSGSTYSLGDTGGSNTVTLTSPQIPVHSHPAPASVSPVGSHTHPRSTGTSGAHTHPNNGIWQGFPGNPIGGPGTARIGNPSPSTGPGGGHSHPFAMGDAGGHTHPISVTINPAGAGDAHENRPPYYAIAFIMRL